MAEHAPDAQPHEPVRQEPSSPHQEPEEYSRPTSMTLATRVVLGILAFVPIVLVGLILVQYVGTTEEAAAAGGGAVGLIFVLALLVFFFAAFVFNDKRVPIRAKRFWLAGFLVGGPIVIPLYWYMHVLRAPRHSASG